MDSLEEVDVVFAHNDVMAMAARRAIERMHPGLADRISFVGIDAVSGRGSGLEAVMHGELAGLVSDGWEPCYPCSHADIERRRCVPAIFAIFCLDR